MGELELGSVKGVEYGGEGENRNVEKQDERIESFVDFCGL